MNMRCHEPWRLVQNRIRGRGGREIDKFRGVSPAVDDETGSEAWIGSVTAVNNPPADHPHWGCAEVTLPDGRRMYLFEAIHQAPLEILGRRHMERNGEGLGMLVKFLDARTQYGLQCHPTRPFAKKMWNSDYGKEESWYVLGTREDAKNPAYILLGFKEGVTRETWEAHYRNDDIRALENLCHRIEVRVGDAFFIGGGVPHALGEGCFVIEVQEPSDITLGAHTYGFMKSRGYRSLPDDEALYDERLLGAYQYDGLSEEEALRRYRIPRKPIRGGAWGSEAFVIGPEQTAFFSFTELAVHGEAPLIDTGFPKICIVTSGGGEIAFDGGAMRVKRGDELFLPYDVPGARILGDVTVVLCHPEGAY